jgi:hypothetical protein
MKLCTLQDPNMKMCTLVVYPEILYTAKFTHHVLKFHKVWWKSDKRCGSWSGQTDGQTGRFPIYPPNYVCGGGGKKNFPLDRL